MAAARFQLFSVVGNRNADSLAEQSTAQPVAWRFLSANNRSIAQSAVTFADLGSCLSALHAMREQLERATCSVTPDVRGQWTWRVCRDGSDLALSTRCYQRRVHARESCGAFVSLASEAPIPLRIVKF